MLQPAATVDPVRLLSLDTDPVYGSASRATFAGDVSVFDYDTVVWSPARTFQDSYADLAYNDQYMGLPSLSEAESVRIQSDVARRRTEFAEFISSGKALVVFAGPPLKCYVETGDRTYSGTGRNQKTTRIVKQFDLWSAMPCKPLDLAAGTGRRIATVGDGPLKRLLDKYSDRLVYRAVLGTPPGSPAAIVEGTDRVVASILRTKAGGVCWSCPASTCTSAPVTRRRTTRTTTKRELTARRTIGRMTPTSSRTTCSRRSPT